MPHPYNETQSALALCTIIDPFASLGVRTDAAVLLCFARLLYHSRFALSSTFCEVFLRFFAVFLSLRKVLLLSPKKQRSPHRQDGFAPAGGAMFLSVSEQKGTERIANAAKKKLWLRRSFRSPLGFYEGPFKNCTVRQLGALRLYETLFPPHPLAAGAAKQETLFSPRT